MDEEEVKIEGKIDLAQAVKELEIKNREQAEKKVVANEPPKVPGMVKMVIKASGGKIDGQKKAEFVLLGVAILFFLASFVLFFIGGQIK